MTALTDDRDTPEKGDVVYSVPVAASTVLYAGSLVCRNADGYATPGATATTLTGAGRAEETVDNSDGDDGDLSIRVRRGVFRFENESDVTIANVGTDAYAVDDQTVSASSDDSTRSVVGTIADVDDLGVWVRF